MKPPRFRVGVCSWSLRPEHPDQLIGLLAQIGITHVQLALVPCVDAPEWQGAVGALRSRGLSIASSMLPSLAAQGPGVPASSIARFRPREHG